MVRFRLYPTLAQEEVLQEHCAHARFVWNLALEQANWHRPHWGPTPGYKAQSAQLTEARAASAWLASGSFTVQQQALRDFAQAMKNFWAGTHGRPTWRRNQAAFRCVACGHIEHADTNAARNILAARRAVTARGGEPSSPSNREPQPRSLRAASLESAGFHR